MHNGEIFIPIIFFITFFAMIFGVVYLRTRENMALIERGLNPKEFANRPAPFRSLKAGLLIFGAGLGLLIAFIIDNNLYNGNFRHDGIEAIYFALIAIGGGLGLIASYAVEKKQYFDKKSL